MLSIIIYCYIISIDNIIISFLPQNKCYGLNAIMGITLFIYSSIVLYRYRKEKRKNDKI